MTDRKPEERRGGLARSFTSQPDQKGSESYFDSAAWKMGCEAVEVREVRCRVRWAILVPVVIVERAPYAFSFFPVGKEELMLFLCLRWLFCLFCLQVVVEF